MFLGDERMDASEVIGMVAETAHSLAALASDETVTHGAPDRCIEAAHDLETSVALILTARGFRETLRLSRPACKL